MSERVPTEEAAAILGVGVPTLRYRMRIGVWKHLGEVIPTGGSKRKYTYNVYREKLNKHIGKG